MFYILSFFFGASIGSFVQVIATRLNVASIIKTRSKCLSCGEALRAYDLFPIFSYLLLRGKCRHCKSSYGISALIIEAIYGLVFVLLYQFMMKGEASLSVSAIWFVYYTLLFITLGVIALYDKAHSYIPVSYLFGYLMLSLIVLVKSYINEPSFLIIVAPFAVALPFLLIWIVSKGKALGFGDVILFFGVGAFFGLAQGSAVFLISIWAGAIFGAVKYFLTEKSKRKNMTIPFVPFIVFAFLFVLFTDIDLFSIASLFA
ncbi:TPA: hypothetical protein DEP94_04155 [Candidatus Nomurabacteria bacterium]|nr:hypothetical protein [Candidatus Nomurabacteria bacterium]